MCKFQKFLNFQEEIHLFLIAKMNSLSEADFSTEETENVLKTILKLNNFVDDDDNYQVFNFRVHYKEFHYKSLKFTSMFIFSTEHLVKVFS